jgi:hypothetical protein
MGASICWWAVCLECSRLLQGSGCHCDATTMRLNTVCSQERRQHRRRRRAAFPLHATSHNIPRSTPQTGHSARCHMPPVNFNRVCYMPANGLPVKLQL